MCQNSQQRARPGTSAAPAFVDRPTAGHRTKNNWEKKVGRLKQLKSPRATAMIRAADGAHRQKILWKHGPAEGDVPQKTLANNELGHWHGPQERPIGARAQCGTIMKVVRGIPCTGNSIILPYQFLEIRSMHLYFHLYIGGRFIQQQLPQCDPICCTTTPCS